MDQEWADEQIALFQCILGRINRGGFPDHLVDPIRAALTDPETRFDMVQQLLRLCEIAPFSQDVRAMRAIDGRLLYANGTTAIAWGTETFVCERDFSIIHGPAVIGGKPWWIERSRKLRRERVNWAGRVGTLYPDFSIHAPKDRGGIPCYAVNDEEGDPREGFVVVDETEGKHYKEVSHLVIAAGAEAYVAFGSQRAEFVWDGETIREGYSVSQPVVVDDIPHVAVRVSDDSQQRELWRGRGCLLTADTIDGPSVVNGQLAYATRVKVEGVTHVFLGGKSIEYKGWTRDWWTPRRANSAFVVYSICTERSSATYANHVKLCDGTPEPNTISLRDDGITLSLRLEGKHETCNFNLKDLGAV